MATIVLSDQSDFLAIDRARKILDKIGVISFDEEVPEEGFYACADEIAEQACAALIAAGISANIE